MVETIATPQKHTKAGGVVYTERVSGDRRGILESGRSVLAEVKSIEAHDLQWSDLRKHQPARLTRHAEYNGLSLLVWVTKTEIYVMEWADVIASGFGPGESIDADTAEHLHLTLESRRKQEDYEWRRNKPRLITLVDESDELATWHIETMETGR